MRTARRRRPSTTWPAIRTTARASTWTPASRRARASPRSAPSGRILTSMPGQRAFYYARVDRQSDLSMEPAVLRRPLRARGPGMRRRHPAPGLQPDLRLCCDGTVPHRAWCVAELANQATEGVNCGDAGDAGDRRGVVLRGELPGVPEDGPGARLEFADLVRAGAGAGYRNRHQAPAATARSPREQRRTPVAIGSDSFDGRSGRHELARSEG